MDFGKEQNRTAKSKKGVLFGMKTWQYSICIGVDRYQVLCNHIWCHKLKCCWFWSGLYSWNSVFRLQLQASKISAFSFRSIWSIEGWKPSSYLCNSFAQQIISVEPEPQFQASVLLSKIFSGPNRPEMLGLRIHNLESNTQNFAFANSKI